jgi:hypothetical protein
VSGYECRSEDRAQQLKLAPTPGCRSGPLLSSAQRDDSRVQRRLPISLVAQVDDASAAMIQTHYARYNMDATDDLLRRATLSLT